LTTDPFISVFELETYRIVYLIDYKKNEGIMKYVNALQGKTVRYELGKSSDIGGVYTSHFQCCNIIVIMGARRISLSHADATFKEPWIQEELNWVGEPSKKFIIKRDNDMSKFIFKHILPTLGDLFKPVEIRDTEEAVTVDPFSASFCTGLNKDFDIVNHPKVRQISYIYYLNNLLNLYPDEYGRLTTDCKKLSPTRIIFDGEKWADLLPNDIELTVGVKAVLNEMHFTQFSSRKQIKEALHLWLVNYKQDVGLSSENVDKHLESLTDSVQRYLYDAEKLFAADDNSISKTVLLKSKKTCDEAKKLYQEGNIKDEIGKQKLLASVNLFRECLNIIKEIHGESHEEIATIKWNLGSALFKLGQYKEAQSLIRDCCLINQRLFVSSPRDQDKRKRLIECEHKIKEIETLDNNSLVNFTTDETIISNNSAPNLMKI
jgi:tetratricopeptide (TPR) repeat protein